jgi:CBS domain-containing protein
MRLSDVMSRPVVTVEAGMSVLEAQAVMRTKGFHHLAVRVEGKGIGVVSHHDLAAARPEQKILEIMPAQVVTASPRTTVRQAANLMRGRAVGCLLVVEGEKPVGIVTVSDLLMLVGKGMERPVARSRRWTMRARGSRQKNHQRTVPR